MFLNPEPYLKKAIRISSFKGDTRATLLEKKISDLRNLKFS